METEQKRTSPWIYVALAAAIILSFACGFVVGGVGGYLVGRKGARVASTRPPATTAPPATATPAPREPESERPERFILPRVAYGALVRSVTADGPADKAGIKVGDIIIAVEGEPLSAERDLRTVIRSYQPGDRIELTIIRPGDMVRGYPERKIEVELGSQRDEQGKTVAILGVTVAEVRGGMFSEPED